MNKRLKLKKGILHKKCDESCPRYREIIHYRLITNNGCTGCKFHGEAHEKLCKPNDLARPRVYQVDDYYKVVAENEEEAKELYLNELCGVEEDFECREINPTRHKMWYPIEWLPKEFHKEPFKNYEVLCTEIPLSIAMHYREDKPPYVLAVSSELL